MNKNLLFKNLFFGSLYTSFSVAPIFFMLGMPMILQIQGYDASIIGLFQIVGLPMVLKLFFSPPVDKFRFEKNHYKKWIFPVGVLYFLLLLYSSFLSIEENIIYLFMVVFITSLVATFIDIPLNALSIKVFSKDKRIIAGGFKISSYFISLILGGGVLLISYNKLGWQTTLQIIAFMVLTSLVSLLFIKEENSRNLDKIATFKDIISYIKGVNKSWLMVLLVYFMFISAVWIFLKPFLIKKGVNANDVAFYVGIYGGIVGIISGLMMKFFQKFDKKSLLVGFGVLNFFAILSLILMQKSINKVTILSVITFISMSFSFSSSLIFSMMMDYARASTKAIDYAIESSIFSLTRIFSAIIAGFIVSNFGFSKMFVFELFGMGLVVFLVHIFYKPNEAQS